MDSATLVAIITSAAGTLTALGALSKLKTEHKKNVAETESTYAAVAQQFAQASSVMLTPLLESASAMRTRIATLEAEIHTLSEELVTQSSKVSTAEAALLASHAELDMERRRYLNELTRLQLDNETYQQIIAQNNNGPPSTPPIA